MIMVTSQEPSSPDGRSVLAERAFKDLKSTLSSYGSTPGPEAAIALQAVLATMEAGLRSELPPSFYLSAMDPGTGKSLAVAMFLRAYKAAGFLPGNGVLVLVSRLAEIESYLAAAGLDRHEVAVLTSDKQLNELGAPEAQHGQAPVMFTTQQRLAARGAKMAMSELPAFFFNGSPRALRIWDESILPGAPKTVKVDDLGALLGPLRASKKTMAAAVQSIMVEAWQSDPGTVLEVPEALGGNWGKAANCEGAAELSALAGCEVRTVAIGDDVRLAGAAPTLPADFAPAIVLDASGRVREAYRLWERCAGSLVRLPSTHNDYREMVVHIWRHASGRRTLADAKARRAIVAAVVEAVRRRPNEEWLVVHYRDAATLMAEVKGALGSELAGKVHGLTWGRHHGTNAFAHVPNIILVGQPDYGQHGFEAVAAASIGDGMVPRLSNEERVALRGGEIAHNLLQAVCRSRARMARKGIAGACQVYLCISAGPGLEAVLDECFPGHHRRNWLPVEPTGLSGRKGDFLRFLTRRFEGDQCATIRKKEVVEALGILSPALSRLLADAAVQEALDSLWIEVQHNAFMLRRPSFDAYPGGGFSVTEHGL